MAYMNVVEVESALIGLAAAHPAICELVTLPHATVEGRTTHAVRIGTHAANTVDAYFLTGGVHAREWGSCEILVNLATDLCDAYAGGTGVGYGGKYYSAAEVRAIVEQINVIIFPCVNPDGRNYSQTAAPLWRKNRNPAQSAGDATRVGVDINRNQDFLWNFNAAFAPGAISDSLASNDTHSGQYHGPSPASEAETRNINYLHDTYTRIRWYIDVHSFSEDILYVWGDDESQLTDTSKRFTNAAFDGARGVLGDGYGEYIRDDDLLTLTRLAGAFTHALSEVRGKLYVAKPGFSLYATSGTNDDYAYSRHIADSSKAKTLAFTVEWGTEFQPAWAEMQEIIKDVSSGLLGLGLEALGIDSYIVTNRDTFSSYEVATTATYPEAFYVFVDGFAPSALGLPGTEPTARFLTAVGGAAIASISATRTATDLEDPGAPDTPQRVRLTYQIEFADASAFTAETRTVVLEVKVAGIADVAPIQLLTQPNPYMVDGAVSWLSTDVRVFQLRPGERVNASSTSTLGNPDVDGAAPYTYIHNLIGELRASGNAPAPAFEAISQDEQTSQLELSRTVAGHRVCNFAVAKVRYRASSTDATDVRVFFRTFNTMVSDLTYSTNPAADVQNYRRTAAGTTPLLGTNAFFSGGGNQIVSIPYFAEARVDTGTTSMATQTDPLNRHTIAHAGATEAVQYFGCWLDFNQTDARFPVNLPNNDGPFSGRVPIMQLVRGIHQCLVAEVRFQPGAADPIPGGASPGSSDRLAQRNLAIVESDNPGTAATHVVQHTLLVKPSKWAGLKVPPEAQLAQQLQLRADELVIRWHDVPAATRATLYFPEWSADEIVALAAARPGATPIERVDANTIAVPVRDVSYIPIPSRVERPSPGLLTLELPLGVRTGQQFKVDVQQHAGPTLRRSLVVHEPDNDKTRARLDYELSARKVQGAFRLTIAVKEGVPLLAKQVRNLAVLKYIHQAIPATDSWHPVFVRYIAQLATKVRGLGVDPDRVPASADDPGLPGRDASRTFTGKIRDVVFDCFGDLEGFVVETCGEHVRVRSTERRIGELAWRACVERAIVTVRLHDGVLRELIILSGWPA